MLTANIVQKKLYIYTNGRDQMHNHSAHAGNYDAKLVQETIKKGVKLDQNFPTIKRYWVEQV